VDIRTILVIAAVIAGVYVWGWRRFRALRGYWQYVQYRERSDKVLATIREARDNVHRRRYRLANEHDRELTSLRGTLDRDAAALVACGFIERGDVIMCRGDEPRAIARAFTDTGGTTCAVVGLHHAQPDKPWVWLGSYRADERFATWRGGGSLAEPPHVHEQKLAGTTPVADLVAGHRTFARTDEPDRGFARMAKVDDMLAQFAAADATQLAWRAEQQPDQLLDADLRAALGEQYNRVGKHFARRLRDDLPRATARPA
jgi:hypothetical protein